MSKILVVEDDTVWQKIILSQLSGLQGITNIAVTGEDAILLFDEAVRLRQPYDACVLDSMFPKKGGGLPDYSSPLEIALNFVNAGNLPPHRVFVVGSVADYVKEAMEKLGLKHFYSKDRESKQPYQRHYSRLRADLSQSFRR